MGNLILHVVGMLRTILVPLFSLLTIKSEKIDNLNSAEVKEFRVILYKDKNLNLQYETFATSIQQISLNYAGPARINLEYESQTELKSQTCLSPIFKLVCPETNNYCATFSGPKNRKFIKLTQYIKMLYYGMIDDSYCNFYASKDDLLPVKTIDGSFERYLNRQEIW